MNQIQQDTEEPISKLNQLMLTDEPIGEIQDFLNYSLSDGNFSIQGSRVNTNNNIPSQSSKHKAHESKRVTFDSSLSSPTNKFLMNKKSLKTSELQQFPQQQIFSVIQFCFIKRFINRISWKKKINSQFNLYQYNIIQDLGSSFNLKLFRDSALNLKPMVSQFSQSPEGLQQFVKKKELSNKIKTQITYLKTCKDNLIKKLEQEIEKIPLITPESRLKIVWDCIVMMSRLYFLFVIPIDLAWDKYQIIYGELYIPTILMILLLVFDFILSFNSSFYQFGQIVSNRATIAKNVISKSYGLEAISILILIIYAMISKSSQYEFNLLTDWNIPKLISQVEETLNLSKPSSSLLELFKLLLVLFFVLHCYSCLWYFVGYYSYLYSEKGSWLEFYHVEHETWQVQYLYSFYFSTVTMFTIGYGDVVPISYLERVVAILYMMVCSIQLSYSVSTVGTIIDTISAYGQEKMRKMRKINSYMQNRKIEYQLQYQIREYLNYYWESQNQVENDELNDIMNQLSENLKEKLMNQSNSLIFQECPLFKNNFSDALKSKLVNKIKQAVIQPENIINFDSIFPQQTPGQLFVCFVEYGEIQIFIQNDSVDQVLDNPQIAEVFKVGKGSSLGIISFISGKQSQERFRSVGFSKLLMLSRDDFLKVIQDFPEDYERFRNLYDSLQFEDLSALQMKCFSCNSKAHRVLQCPLLHYIPDKELIIKRFCYSQSQNRNSKYGRNPFRQRGYFAARFDQEVIEQEANSFNNNNWKWAEFYEEPEEDSLKKSDNHQQQIGPVQEQSNQNLQTQLLQQSQNIINTIQPVSDQSSNSKINLELPTIKKKATLFKQRTKTIELLDIDDKQLKATLMSKARNQNIFNNNLMIIKEEDNQENSPREKPMLGGQSRGSFSLDLFKKKPKENFQKMKKVVQMITNMNRMKKRQKLKKETKSIINQFLEVMQSQQLLKGLLAKVRIRIKQIQDGKKQILQEKDIQDTLLLEIKLKMEIEQINEYQQKDQDQIMESYKKYKYYQIQNNLDQILEKMYFYKQQNTFDNQLKSYQSKLLQYMIYPEIFFEKYRYQQVIIPKFEVEESRRGSEQDSERTLKRSRMIKKSFRNLKLSQIRPMSDGTGKFQM
ncbi:unnamed protein product (macronuclear) [Paramecium tetraurelia]|uniref:Cyclic nucleotide-binding domain-containing protein n=1 Tax=Paramecium tetraurelia TaxID=5888 RepID=A0D372_PARTE|nr:uncharacterized protein GSPATT00012974001 [Paramecium tetraurelia]CAK77489.1 unnamed protein product [Paramecium tetraurelia]|eukprot:XP_001444886.1 hypothetical protein (macronuclear) [Paramecium tetraurelia strain d4-2]